MIGYTADLNTFGENLTSLEIQRWSPLTLYIASIGDPRGRRGTWRAATKTMAEK